MNFIVLISLLYIIQLITIYYSIYTRNDPIENVLSIYAISKILIIIILYNSVSMNYKEIKKDINKNFDPKRYGILRLSVITIILFILLLSVPVMVITNYGLINWLALKGIDHIFNPILN